MLCRRCEQRMESCICRRGPRRFPSLDDYDRRPMDHERVNRERRESDRWKRSGRVQDR